MIDYIAVTKHFQNKDKPFLNNCPKKTSYEDTGCTKYILHGCKDLKLYWYENSNTLKLQGSITYFIQGHNFTYSNSIFCEAIKTIENILKCYLWDGYVDEFEYGKIIKVEYEPKEYISRHYSNDKKLIMNEIGKDRGYFKWWEAQNLSLKMYDINRNINNKQTSIGKQILIDAGWNPKEHYLKWEVHYKKPHQYFNNGIGIKLADLVKPAFQTTISNDLVYQYSRLSTMKSIITPNNKKDLKTSDIILLELAENMINNNLSIKEIKKKLYNRINNISKDILADNDKKARKRQINLLIKNLKEESNSKWDITEKLKKQCKLT